MKRIQPLSVAMMVLALGGSSPRAFAADKLEVQSPDGKVRFVLVANPDRLMYTIRLNDREVLASSPMGIVVDGDDLGRGAGFGPVERFNANETYPTRGVHSRAVNHFNKARVSARHEGTKTDFVIDVRVFDDGVAFRFVVPGEKGRARVPDESTAFRLPEGSAVWYHNLRGHYEGMHARKAIADVTAGDWAAPPLTIQLPEGLGYAAITEAALSEYAGMALQATGDRGFAARLGHAHPASYPFTLRYGEAEAKRLASPAAIEGIITTPWRVVMVGADLNTLVNCDIVSNVSPPPDPKLFPKGLETDWIRPGRAVWMYLDGGQKTIEGVKEFSRQAGELGFEHQIVEGFWRRWSDSELRDVVEYSKARGVGIWLWEHSKSLRTPEARRAFFEHCREAGVSGVKLDFFDHEARDVVALYETCLREAAEAHLMVDFHGANKPTGESRTWPNEMTREAIRGLEGRQEAWARHNATWPFTRLLAGHADYTPMHFGDRRRETSWAHQIASAAVLTSPVLVYAANPKSMLENPAVEMIKSVPSVWDETVVLPVSEIGELAAFARRKGDRWFLAVVNGPTARTLRLPPTFLTSGDHKALLVRDDPDNPASVKIETTTVARDAPLTIDLRAGGGFIARFDKTP